MAIFSREAKISRLVAVGCYCAALLVSIISIIYSYQFLHGMFVESGNTGTMAGFTAGTQALLFTFIEAAFIGPLVTPSMWKWIGGVERFWNSIPAGYKIVARVGSVVMSLVCSVSLGVAYYSDSYSTYRGMGLVDPQMGLLLTFILVFGTEALCLAAGVANWTADIANKDEEETRRRLWGQQRYHHNGTQKNHNRAPVDPPKKKKDRGDPARNGKGQGEIYYPTGGTGGW